MNFMNISSGIKTNGMHSALALAALCLCVTVASAQTLPGGPPGGGLFTPGPPGFGLMPPPLAANAPPPSADPRNFEGTWHHPGALVPQISTDMFGNTTPFNDEGRKVMDRRVKSLKDGTPFINASAKCLPPGQPWQMDLSMPFHIFQSKDRLEVLFEEYHNLVTISLDAAKAPAAGYMGRSVAHWDGDTLVVEITGYKDALWLDINGTPASKNAKLTQRIRKVKSDNWYLEVINTLEDATYYTRPWSWVRQYDWRPDMMMFREYNCELQSGSKDGMDPSLIEEPQN